MWRFRLSSSLKMAFTKITRSTRGARSTRNGRSTRTILDEEGEGVRVISDEEVDNDRFLRGLLQQEKRRGSNMDHFNREREVDNDEQLPVLYGLPQQGKRSPVVLHKCYRRKMIGAVFDVGRVSRFQRGLLNGSFSSIVVHKNYKRRGFVQS